MNRIYNIFFSALLGLSLLAACTLPAPTSAPQRTARPAEGNDRVSSTSDKSVAGAPGRGKVETMRLSPAGETYIDHEILQSEGLMVYQQAGEGWIARLDPRTGYFMSKDGKDLLVDRNITTLQLSKNGPEFGIDANGWAIYYNKMHNGHIQIWRAEVNGERVTPAVLTSDSWDRINQLPSHDPSAPSTYVIYGRGKFMSGGRPNRRGAGGGGRYKDPDRTIAWLDAARPAAEHEITLMVPGAAGFRWIENTSQFVTTKSDGPDFGQIEITDVRTGKSRVITNDAGTKFDPYGWRAPEFQGQVLVLAALNNSSIGIYRDKGGRYWERIATLSTPPQSRLRYIQSSEPFTAGGRSFISNTVKKQNDKIFHSVTEAEIWIYGIDDDPARRYVLRCDDGAPGIVRHEAETFRGTDEVFLYYNKITAGRGSGRTIELHLCRTGISSRTGEPSI